MGSESQAPATKCSLRLSHLCATETSSLALQASRISQRALRQFAEELQTHLSNNGKRLQNVWVLGLYLTHPANTQGFGKFTCSPVPCLPTENLAAEWGKK